MKRTPPSSSDLTAKEQDSVRAALRFLKLKFRTWEPLSKALGFKRDTLSDVVSSGTTVTASLAFRVARLVKVGIDDLLAGKYPELGTCPYCGHKMEPGTEPASVI